MNVYTLLVEVGRTRNDGLPDGSTGAALICYAAGHDEAEAVRETVAIRRAGRLSRSGPPRPAGYRRSWRPPVMIARATTRLAPKRKTHGKEDG